MKDYFPKIIKHPLVTGTSIVFLGSTVVNLFSYSFNLVMGRWLTVEDYGTLISLNSLLAIFSVLSTALTTTFAKYSAHFFGKKEMGRLRELIRQGTLWVWLISVVFSLILLLFIPLISSYLHIAQIFLILVTLGNLFFTLVSSVPSGVLQGVGKFVALSTIGIASSLIKFSLGFILVYFGYRVFGANLGIFLSVTFSYFFAFLPLRRFLKKNDGNNLQAVLIKKEVFFYGFQVLLSSLGIMLLAYSDLILVKHYFSPIEAGRYSALSLMGKAIFYVTSPINFVLFPLIAQKRARRESTVGTLTLAALLITGCSLSLSFVYFIFPNVVLKIFFPSSPYAILVKYLGPFSLFVFIFSLAFLLNGYFLSIGKTKVYFFTIAAGLLQIILLNLFHHNFIEIIIVLSTTSLLLLISFLLYYRHVTKT